MAKRHINRPGSYTSPLQSWHLTARCASELHFVLAFCSRPFSAPTHPILRLVESLSRAAQRCQNITKVTPDEPEAKHARDRATDARLFTFKCALAPVRGRGRRPRRDAAAAPSRSDRVDAVAAKTPRRAPCAQRSRGANVAQAHPFKQHALHPRQERPGLRRRPAPPRFHERPPVVGRGGLRGREPLREPEVAVVRGATQS